MKKELNTLKKLSKNSSRPTSSDTIPDLRSLELLANILDTRFGIFGDRFRFGLDSLIGLIPGIGDFAGAGLSSYIIYQAYRNGVSAITLGRMIRNVLIDTIVGAVPLLGDLFDLGWRANTKNVNLALNDLRHHQRESRSTSQLVRTVVIFCGLLLFTILGLFIALIYKLIF